MHARRNPKSWSIILVTTALTSAGCDLKELLSPSGALGTSTLSAYIDGTPVSFKNVSAVSYFGASAEGTSDAHRIRLYLWYGEVTSHTWGPFRGQFSNADTSAFLDGRPALNGWGGFTITSHDRQRRRMIGTFSFAVFDSGNPDTTFVTQGRFDLYYPFAD